MKRLVQYIDYGRGFTIESLFVANEDDWNRLKVACESKRSVHFGEIGGKHSNVSSTLELGDFKILSEDQGFIESFEKIVGSCFGESVLGRLFEECEECGEYLDDEGNCPLCDESELDDEDEDDDD